MRRRESATLLALDVFFFCPQCEISRTNCSVVLSISIKVAHAKTRVFTPPFRCQQQNKNFELKEHLLEQGEEEVEHEKEYEKWVARIILDSGEISTRIFFARARLHFLYRAHLFFDMRKNQEREVVRPTENQKVA